MGIFKKPEEKSIFDIINDWHQAIIDGDDKVFYDILSSKYASEIFAHGKKHHNRELALACAHGRIEYIKCLMENDLVQEKEMAWIQNERFNDHQYFASPIRPVVSALRNDNLDALSTLLETEFYRVRVLSSLDYCKTICGYIAEMFYFEIGLHHEVMDVLELFSRCGSHFSCQAMEYLSGYLKYDTYLKRLQDISDKQPDKQAKMLAEGDRFLLKLSAFFGQDDISSLLLKFLELEDVQALELECARTTDRSECMLIFDHLLLRRKQLSEYQPSYKMVIVTTPLSMDSALDREKNILATAVYQKIIHENPELLGSWIAQVLVDSFLLTDGFDESLHALMQYKSHLSSNHWRIILDCLTANISECFLEGDAAYKLVRILCHDDIYPNLVHASKNSADILEKHLMPNSPGILRELTESGERYAHRYQMLPQLLAAMSQEHQRDKCFIEALMGEKDNIPVDCEAFFSNILEYLIPVVSYPENLTRDEYRSTLKAHVESLPWFSALIRLLASVESAKDDLTKAMSDIYYYALKDNNTTKLRALFRIHAVISFNLRNRLKESSKHFPQRPSTGVISFSLEKDEWRECREASAMVHDNRLDIL